MPPPPRIAGAIAAAVDALAGDLVAAAAGALRIPSVNPRYPGEVYEDHVGGEGAVTALLAELHARAGCTVDRFGLEPGRENCVGTLAGAGGGRSLILNGHVDVVPPGPVEEWTGGDPWSGRVADGRLWGRGACDMKAAVVAQAFAALALREAGVTLRGDLVLQAVVGEETMEHGLGTTACVERGHRADGAIVGEASNPPAPLCVYPATPGVLRCIITIHGRRAHPGMRGRTIHAGGGGWDVGVNAIDRAFVIYEALARLEREWALTKVHPLFPPGQFGIQPGVFVGSPRGQLDPFFIPDHATLDYIVIHHPDESEAAVRAEIEAVVAAAAATDGWLRAHPPECDWVHAWPPSSVDPGHPLVAAACAAHEASAGEPALVGGWTAVHDGTYLNAAGIPAIGYGPGDLRHAHAPDERVAIDELVAATRTYALLAADWCGVTSGATGSPP
jgi:acetylornithine deacetylase